MKRLPILLLFIFIVSCSSRHRVRIEGNFADVPDKSYVFLEEILIGSEKLIDSSLVSPKGQFHFSVPEQDPGFYRLRFSSGAGITLLAQPGEKIQLSGNYNELPARYSVEGSTESSLVQKLNQNLIETGKKLDSLVHAYRNLLPGTEQDEARATIDQEYIAVLKAQKKYSIEFILNHYKSMASIIALYQKINDSTWVFDSPRELQYFKIVSDSLGKIYPWSNHVKALKSDLNIKLAEHKALVLQNLALQSPVGFPDLALPDKNDEVIHLNSFTGKVILLNFWTYSSPECLMQNREFIDLYRKFGKNGLVVYSVSLDQDKEKWVLSANEPGSDWINVMDRSGAAASLYNVKNLPFSLLIDRNGDISGKNMDLKTLEVKIPDLIRKK